MPLYQRRTIERVFNEDAYYIRDAEGKRAITGKWVDGISKVTKIRVATQPIQFREMRSHRIENESGSKMKRIREFFFHMPGASPLRPDKTDGDVIRYNESGEEGGDVDYKLESINVWTRGGYVEVIAVAEQPTSKPGKPPIPPDPDRGTNPVRGYNYRETT